MDGLRRYTLEQHVGVVMRRESPDSYFSVRHPAGAIRTLKSTLAVCEFGSGGLDDEHEFGVSGDAPDVRAAATVPGAAEMSDRGRQLVFFGVLGSNLAQANRIKVAGQQKLSGVHSITCHQLLEFDQEKSKCVCSIGGMVTSHRDTVTGGARHCTMTLHPATLSSENLLSMWLWKGQEMTLRFAQNYALPARYSLSAPDVLKVLSLRRRAF